MPKSDVTIKLEAFKLTSLLKVLQHLTGNELEHTAGHEITLKFGGIDGEHIGKFIDDLDTYLSTQHQVKSKITTKSVLEVFAPPPPADSKPETLNFFSIRPRMDEERN